MTARPVERALLVLAVAGLAAAVAQSVLLVRVMIRFGGSPAPLAATGPDSRERRPRVGDISAVPPQDPHSPPTSAIRITHVPPARESEPAALVG